MSDFVSVGKAHFRKEFLKGMTQEEFVNSQAGRKLPLKVIWERCTGKKWDDGPTEPRKKRTGRKRSTEKDSPEAGD